jgi:hypothetical protein
VVVTTLHELPVDYHPHPMAIAMKDTIGFFGVGNYFKLI